MQSGRFVWADSEGRDAKRDLRAGGLSGIHPTREGDIYISAHSSHFWQALCELVGLPELADDTRYDTLAKRADRAEELIVKLREALATRNALAWEEVFGHRVTCSQVRPNEGLYDPHQVMTHHLGAPLATPRLTLEPGRP